MASDRIVAGQRLAKSLRRIRESRGIDLVDFVSRTKAAPDIVAEFETNCLVDHPMYNRVYLRPFAREYAESVGLPVSRVLRAVDAALEGRYDSSLAVEFLGDVAEDERTEFGTKGSDPAFEFVAGLGIGDGDEPEVDPDATALSPRARVMSRSGLRWSGLGLAAVVIIVLSVWMWSAGDDGKLEQSPVPLVPSEPVVELPPRIVVSNVMQLWVVALDTLNPVRVTVDDRPRAPYWIELGDSMSFEVSDQIVFEREVDQLAVSYQGVRVPLGRADSLGRLRLSRRRVQELLDSLRTAR